MARPRIGAFVLSVLLAAGSVYSEITFQVSTDAFSSTPAAVFLAGAFNGWDVSATPMTREGADWVARLALPDGRHFYKFVWQDARENIHWINDPTNPFIADNGDRAANNFVDVQDGRRVLILDGLEAFQWPPPTTRTLTATDGTRTWGVLQEDSMHPELVRRRRSAKWVVVAGDFNDWRLGQFPLARGDDGIFRAYIPIRRPFSYKLIIDGMWRLDPGNEARPTLWVVPGQPTRNIPSSAIWRVPDGFGQYNSYREQTDITSPALVVIEQAVAAGDPSALDEVNSYMRAADYGRTVALARKIRAVNEAVGGEPQAGLALESLALEGKAHKRWARQDEAAKCWEAILAADRLTSFSREAAVDLAAYYIFVKRDHAAARLVYEWAMRQGFQGADGLALFTRFVNATMNEGLYADALDMVDLIRAHFPAPDGRDKAYACEYSELFLAKGIVLFYRKEWEQARQAFEKVIEIHPWADSQNAQRARQWLGYVKARKVDPQDVYY